MVEDFRISVRSGSVTVGACADASTVAIRRYGTDIIVAHRICGRSSRFDMVLQRWHA